MNLVRVPSLNELLIKRLPPRKLSMSKRPTSKSTAATSPRYFSSLGAGGFVSASSAIASAEPTMMLTILIYAIFTGEAAWSNHLTRTRSMRSDALGVGGRMGRGGGAVAEVFSSALAADGAGLLQALSGHRET